MEHQADVPVGDEDARCRSLDEGDRRVRLEQLEAHRGLELPDLNPELLELLLHIVVTHLRLPEWGSPRLPCIPEVLIVHHADDLDAKFEMYARCLTKDVADGPFTERDPNLGRALLKGRKV